MCVGIHIHVMHACYCTRRGCARSHEARARARQTASELGVRGPPAARTKSRKATSSSAVHDEGGLLAEADALIAESSPTGALRFDRTEEELMADILQEVN